MTANYDQTQKNRSDQSGAAAAGPGLEAPGGQSLRSELRGLDYQQGVQRLSPAGAPVVQLKEGPDQVKHTVAPGETLGAIAKRYYGKASRWKEIAEANGITDPKTVKAGTVLVIPNAPATKTPDKSSDPPSTTDETVTTPTKKADDPKTTVKKDPNVTNLSGEQTYTVVDGYALVRTDPPDLKKTSVVVPQGLVVEAIQATTKTVNKKKYEYVFVVQHLPKGVYGPPMPYGWTSKSNLRPAPGGKPSKEFDPALRSNKQIEVGGIKGSLDRQMANIHNTKGKYLEAKAKALGIKVEDAAAVLKVESGGRGFDDADRLKIRFENHVFYKRWGKSNQKQFDAHFKPRSGSKNHRFRSDAKGTWKSFHGNQNKEWEVLGFARKLDDTAALKSISMGAAQVMGFNYKMIGYKSVQEMFKDMAGSMKGQLDGLFGYIQNKKICREGLKAGNYVKFALGYNGKGKEQTYGAKIEAASKAYKRVMAKAK